MKSKDYVGVMADEKSIATLVINNFWFNGAPHCVRRLTFVLLHDVAMAHFMLIHNVATVCFQTNEEGDSMWTLDPVRKQYYLNQGNPDQPDLNLRNPAVLEELKVREKGAPEMKCLVAWTRGFSSVVDRITLTSLCWAHLGGSCGFAEDGMGN